MMGMANLAGWVGDVRGRRGGGGGEGEGSAWEEEKILFHQNVTTI